MSTQHYIDALMEEGDLEEWRVLMRAAEAVVKSTDSETSFYEAQSDVAIMALMGRRFFLVKDWAIDALGLALSGELDKAEALLDRYEEGTDAVQE